MKKPITPAPELAQYRRSLYLAEVYNWLKVIGLVALSFAAYCIYDHTANKPQRETHQFIYDPNLERWVEITNR